MRPPEAGVDERSSTATVVAGVVLGMLVTGAAVAFKMRCGLPPSFEGQYLSWCYSDIYPLFHVEQLDVGALPYFDHPVEYPPLTGLWMWLASLGATSSATFFGWTSVLLVLSGGATGGAIAYTAGLRRTLVFVLAPTLVISGAVNWDLPSVALAAGGLAAHRRGRDGWAGTWLGLGTAAKLWPVLLLPGVVLGAAALRGRSAALRAVGTAVGTWAALNVPLMIAAPDGWGRFLELSRERPADWDSLWRIVGQPLGFHPSVATLNLVIGLVTGVGILAVLWVTVRKDHPARWHLVGLPVVAWFLLAGKVYSPQFSLWLLPLLALARVGPLGLAAFAVTDVAVTLTRFPYLGTVAGLENGGAAWPFEAAVLARAAVLLTIALLGWRRAAATPTRGRGNGRSRSVLMPGRGTA